MFFTACEKTSFKNATLKFGRHFQKAAHLSRQEGGVLFYTTFKFHLVQHVADQAIMLNPRFLQNYQQEGLVGRIADIFSSTANGPRGKAMHKTALIKYLLGMTLRYEDLV